MGRVDNKVVVITGAGGGMGRSTAQLLAKEGAKVAVTDIDSDGINETVSLVESEGGIARAWTMDVTDERDVSHTIEEIVAEFRQIDVLVNNAGLTGPDGRLHEISVEEWETVFAVDVKGVFLCSKHVIPHMIEQGGGSIINFSSILGLVGRPELPPYSAAKGAVTTMTKNMAVSYGKDKIRVNSVHPGTILTPLVEELASREEGGIEGYRERLGKDHPIGDIGAPNDVAYAVLYLASDESAFTTGLSMTIDGGYTAA